MRNLASPSSLRRRTVALVGTGLASLAIPAIASAHAGNDDPNVVHACVGNVSKVVRVVGVSGSCIASPPLLAETPAHWRCEAGRANFAFSWLRWGL